MGSGKGPSRFTNAPLVYVLAQVRYGSVLSIEKFIADIQENVRKEYPKFRKVTRQSLVVGANGAAPEIKQVYRWEFANKATDTGFIVQPDSLVFHTTNYSEFGDFISQLNFVLSNFGGVVKDLFVERLGLRYIDLIDPDDNESVDDYMVDSVRGFPLDVVDSANLIISNTESIAKTDQGVMVLKAFKKVGEQALPPDLVEAGLTLKRSARPDRMTAILDFDHYKEEPAEFSLDEIITSFELMHDATSSAFRNTITEHAINKWS